MTDELVGRTIGHFLIEEMLAQSGVAKIYRAVQPGLNRTVAIKILPQQFLYDHSFMERFNREVQIIARLQHPHIIPIYDFGEAEGSPYMVMGYYAGETLDRLIQENPAEMPFAKAATIITQAAAALDYAHGEGIIHRNIKPSTIQLDRDHNAYLFDFGVAKVAEATAQLTGDKVLGTPEYMAPEMASPGGVTHQVDVYALGITFYEMMTGSPPFTAPHQIGVLLAHVNQPIPSILKARPDLPEQVQSIVERVLAKDPEERYYRAGEFARALAVIAGVPGPQRVAAAIPASAAAAPAADEMLTIDEPPGAQPASPEPAAAGETYRAVSSEPGELPPVPVIIPPPEEPPSPPAVLPVEDWGDAIFHLEAVPDRPSARPDPLEIPAQAVAGQPPAAETGPVPPARPLPPKPAPLPEPIRSAPPAQAEPAARPHMPREKPRRPPRQPKPPRARSAPRPPEDRRTLWAILLVALIVGFVLVASTAILYFLRIINF